MELEANPPASTHSHMGISSEEGLTAGYLTGHAPGINADSIGFFTRLAGSPGIEVQF